MPYGGDEVAERVDIRRRLLWPMEQDRLAACETYNMQHAACSMQHLKLCRRRLFQPCSRTNASQRVRYACPAEWHASVLEQGTVQGEHHAGWDVAPASDSVMCSPGNPPTCRGCKPAFHFIDGRHNTATQQHSTPNGRIAVRYCLVPVRNTARKLRCSFRWCSTDMRCRPSPALTRYRWSPI